MSRKIPKPENLKVFTVGDLRRLIQRLPDSAPCIESRYSEYGPVVADTFEVKNVIAMANGDWFMEAASDHGDYPHGSSIISALYYKGN